MKDHTEVNLSPYSYIDTLDRYIGIQHTDIIQTQDGPLENYRILALSFPLCC